MSKYEFIKIEDGPASDFQPGSHFGMLTVIKKLPPRVKIFSNGKKCNETMYLCKCECGNETEVSGVSLKNNLVKSCGCLLREKRAQIEDLTGQKFGKLTVLRMSGNYNCKCKCECGKIKTYYIKSLKEGKITSCGCDIGDIVGKKIGNIEVLAKTNEKDKNSTSLLYLCRCFCGKEFKTSKNKLLRGEVSSCGCDSPRNSKINPGDRFGKLTVIKELPERSSHGKRKYLCKCECGNEKAIEGRNLLSGTSTHCGNHSKYEFNTMENRENYLIYNLFRSMYERCYNPNHKAYERYGGRGIKICSEWLPDKNTPFNSEGLNAFYKWCKSHGYKEGLEIDRINNDKGYSPDNCEFVSPSMNINNRSTSTKIEGKNLAEISRENGIDFEIVYNNYKNGKRTIKELIEIPETEK